jgi:Protein of unknown function (DUF1566)
MVAIGVCATFACNLLVGLDKFDKVDCGVGQCEVDAADASVVDVIVDAPIQDVNLGDVLSKPAKWAHWVMPNPVYDAGVSANLNFAQYDAGTTKLIYESHTNLTWDMGGFGPASSEQAAENYCAGRTIGNVTWRVPTRIELVTLLDFTRTASPFVDPIFTTVSGAVWSSSPSRTTAGAFWTVSFLKGTTMVAEADGANVLCVTGGQ